MDKLANLLRQGADKLINLPTEAQRFVTNPQAFVQLLTGKNALPRETGFAAGATGLPAQQGTVLDPNYQAYMQGYEQGEPVSYAAMAAPAVTPVAKALAPKAGQMAENYMVNQGFMPSLIAYHGTPHTIKGKFDISKVGTGEGAQAYGHGMYFAENPAVAKQYQKDLSNFYEPYVQYGKEKIAGQGLSDVDLNVFKYLEMGKKQAGQFPHNTQYYAKKIAEEANDLDALKKLQENSDIKFGEQFNAGNLYKVDIPDEYIPNMLDWDKPLNQQSKELQKAIEATKKFVTKEDLENLGGDINLLYNKDMDVNRFLNTWADLRGKANAGEELLSQVGVKGIRYKDAMSRGADDGTSNFVVFDPSNVKILEQNSKPLSRKEILEQELKKVVE